MPVVVAGGVESISLTQNKHLNTFRAQSQSVLARSPQMYMAMIETAEVVARRYGDRSRGAGRHTRCRASSASLPRTTQAASRRSSRRCRAARRSPTRRAARRRYHDTLLQRDEGYRAGHDARGSREARARLVGRQGRRAGRLHHGGQRLAALGRRGGRRADGREAGGKAWSRAARRLPRHGRGWLPARRDGHRTGVRRAEAARAPRTRASTTSVSGS